MKKYPSISIIFPNFNGGNEPIECISSIYKLNYKKEKIEIIVIDNNSIDGSDKRIKEKFPGTKLIKMKKNVGFAKAVNIGINKSKSDYIFIGNDDLLFEKNSLKKMIYYMESNPEVGITGGKIYSKSNPKKLISCGFNMNNWNGKIFRSPYPNSIHEPDWLQGCCMLVPRKVLKKIGLFDEGFSLAYFEDFDLCIRAKRLGFLVHYIPDAIFWHAETITSNKNKPLKYYHWYKSKIRFVLKNMQILNILTILIFQLFFIMPYRLLVLRDGRFIPFFKGLYWNILHLLQTLRSRQTSLLNI